MNGKKITSTFQALSSYIDTTMQTSFQQLNHTNKGKFFFNSHTVCTFLASMIAKYMSANHFMQSIHFKGSSIGFQNPYLYLNRPDNIYDSVHK